jgi:hypothetical protein
MVITKFWFKVDIEEIFVSNHSFMHIIPIVKQMTVGGAIGSCALWHQKHLKAQSMGCNSLCVVDNIDLDCIPQIVVNL